MRHFLSKHFNSLHFSLLHFRGAEPIPPGPTFFSHNKIRVDLTFWANAAFWRKGKGKSTPPETVGGKKTP